MRIKAGEPAKYFQVTDIFDKPIGLEDYRGKKLLLSFYRYAACPLCNLRVHQLIQHYESFRENGLSLLAFFQSPKDSILKYVGKQDAPFPIVADPKRIVYKAYGVESSWFGLVKGTILKMPDLIKAMGKGIRPGKMEGDIALIPADFLVGPGLIVERAYYGKDIGDHLPVQEIDMWLKETEKRQHF